VTFLQSHQEAGERVYVHCRAGHGRSAAVVFAWLLYQNPKADPLILNQQLCRKRDVRKTLWKQPNLQKFHNWLKEGGRITTSKSSATRGGPSSLEMTDVTSGETRNDSFEQ
jgi:protein-tyrosine phosphatase